MNIKHLLLYLVVCVTVASCTTAKDIPYMIGIDQMPADVLNATSALKDPVIMAGDMLQISVTSSNPSAPEAVKPFNRGGYMSAESGVSMNTGSSDQNNLIYYLVDSNGDIEFPTLGKLHVAGLTKSAIESTITSQIYPRFLTDRPGVEVRLRNFRVYLMGEVGAPGMYTAQNEQMNILQAIALAGDLNLQGKRDNILLIRTMPDGTYTTHRLNLNDKNIITSPYFNLQQNDIIYVEPNASRARSSWSVPPALTLTVSSIGTLISIVTFVVALTK